MAFEILLGFMTSAWLFTLAGVAYGGWRYAYLPFRALRADITTLAREVDALKKEVGLRKVADMSDVEQARRERAARWNFTAPPVGTDRAT